MCVRYTLHKTDAALEAISAALGVVLGSPEWVKPRYNVTLTHTMPVVARQEGTALLRPMRWGLVPAPERASSRPRLLANAKAETVASMPAFRRAAATRRCLVPANGYYEWRTEAGVKAPHLFTLQGDEPFAFAGLWDPADPAFPETYCILTTRPNALAARVHDRMPVLLTGEAMGLWLGEAPLAPAELSALTQPFAAERMQSRPVSRFVSNSRNEGPQCLEAPAEVPGEPEFDFG